MALKRLPGTFLVLMLLSISTLLFAGQQRHSRPIPIIDLAVSALSGNITPSVGLSNVYTVRVDNNGSASQTNYQIKLRTLSNQILTIANGIPLDSLQAVNIEIIWIPEQQFSEPIVAELELPDDEDSSNNLSNSLQIYVQPEGQIAQTVGSGEDNSYLPIAFYQKSSIFQGIYYPEELANTGSITQLSFHANLPSGIPIGNKPLRIWLGSTSLPDLSQGFISSRQLLEVFNGTVYFPAGSGMITINLDTPYIYNGGNLVLNVQRPLDSNYYGYQCYFQCQSLGNSRSRQLTSQTVDYNPEYLSEGNLSGQFPQTTFHFNPTITPPGLLAYPAAPHFDSAVVDAQYSKTLKLTSGALAEITISSITLSGDASISLESLPTLPISLAWGETLSLILNYLPSSAGEHFATLVILDDTSPDQSLIPISGTAIDARISIIPHQQNFDSTLTPFLPSGWSRIVQSPSSNANVYTLSSTTPYSSPNILRFQDSSSLPNNILLISPPFAPGIATHSLKLNFKAKGINSSPNLLVGTTDSISDPTAFTLLSTIPLNSAWASYSVSLAACETEHRQFAFKLNDDGIMLDIYLDDISVDYLPQNDLAATAIFGNPSPVLGQEADYFINVFNWSSIAQANYQVKLFNSLGSELASVNGPTVNPGQNVQVLLSWIPLSETEQSLYGRVVFPQDEFPANNQSPSFSIYPLPSSLQSINIGLGNQVARIPVDVSRLSSLFETIFSASEMSNQSAQITGLRFYNSFNTNVPAMPTKIWLGNTSVNNLQSGWVPASQMFLVFDGPIDCPSGSNAITVNFPLPFSYDGNQNLAMMVQRQDAEDYYSSSCYFRAQTQGSLRSRKVYSNSYLYNPDYPPTNSYLSGQFPQTSFLILPNLQGDISGTITDLQNNPLSGVMVYLTGTEHFSQSDTNGAFSFTDLPAGTYHLEYVLHGYQEYTQTILLEAEEQELLAVQLSPLPMVNVYGQFFASDTGMGLAEASLVLEGYDVYQIITSATGGFHIAGVYCNQTYSYSISANGYSTLTGLINIGDTDYFWPAQTLFELAYPPLNLLASIDNASVNLSWELADSVRCSQNSARDKQTNERTLLGFKLWRLRVGQEDNPPAWISLHTTLIPQSSFTDISWRDLAEGVYRWAVQAIYSAAVESQIAFSNPLLKELDFGGIVGTVRGVNGIPLQGVIVRAGSYSTTTNNWGAFSFAVPLGVYSLGCTTVGYYPLHLDNVEVIPFQNTTVELNLQPVSISDELLPVKVTALQGNFPNPFHLFTNINYSIKEPCEVRLDLYNIKGQLISSLVNEYQPTGNYAVRFDAASQKSKPLASGIYLYRLSAGNYKATGKMVFRF